MGQTNVQDGSLQALSMLRLLDNDPRPTFVLDLDQADTFSIGKPLQLIYCNKSLLEFPGLQDGIRDIHAKAFGQGEVSTQDFQTWCSQRLIGESISKHPPAAFRGLIWDLTTVDHWNVVSARRGNRGYSETIQESLKLNHNTMKTYAESSGQKQPRGHHDTSSADADASNGLFDMILGGSDEEHPLMQIPVQQYQDLLLKLRSQTDNANQGAKLIDGLKLLEGVAIFSFDQNADVIWCNDYWYKLAGLQRGISSGLSRVNLVVEEDQHIVSACWSRLKTEKIPMSFEVRYRTVWQPPFHVDGEPYEQPTWIRSYLHPDLSEDGKFMGISGCTVDISELKWIERIQNRKLMEAEERERLLKQINEQQVTVQLKQQEAAASALRFQRLADIVPVGIFIIDETRLPKYCNEAYYRIVGVDPQRPHRIMPLNELFHDEDVLSIDQHMKQLIEDSHSITLEVRLKSIEASGSASGCRSRAKWILLSAFSEKDNDQQVTSIIGCITDITNIKEVELTQKERLEEAIKAKTQLEQFVDMTSHEIRNPLSSITHSVDDILDDLRRLESDGNGGRHLPDTVLHEANTSLETILHCTQHTKRIVDDILVLSKLNASLLHISPQPVAAMSIASRALKMFEGEMRAAGIEWELTLDDSLRQLDVRWVMLDSARVLQVLMNLIGNSVKFTQHESTRRVLLTMSAALVEPASVDAMNTGDMQYLPKLVVDNNDEHEDQSTSPEAVDPVYLIFRVQDTGCGMSADGRSRIFNRFAQASNRTHVTYGGSGLGLFISRQLCEMQGGRMGFTSIEGEGSTFEFFVTAGRTAPLELELDEIPVVDGASQPPPRERASTETSLAQTLSPTSPPPESRENQHTLLLVEDNLVNQKVLAKQLTKRNFSLLLANHGQEALSSIKQSTFWTANVPTSSTDILAVLMDVEMPVLDGKQTTMRLRELQAEGQIARHVPIIGITANARQEQIEELIEAGMDFVVTKPFRMPELLAILEGFMG